ncbi:glycosyltransferase [Vreelandella malpeensis]|uniref:Rhamnosyl transferase n=1 Tax=Vreelandella malpeensis TaxID=1172368 RepID=A0ABS8DTL6_9GAMM|nr:glycosyltransferase [Halomonas malpeensis]MCB8889544.1 hypothetical protein [Halomonas malpeensis]
MTKKIFIFTRYSVLLKTKAWALSKDNDFDQYREKLFSSERMQQHSFFFKELTIPSILYQKNIPESVDFYYIVLTSKHLPNEERIKLESTLSELQRSKIIYIEPEEDLYDVINNFISKEVKVGEIFASIRLDDDDALHPKFIASVSKYMERSFVGHVISHSRGYATLFDFDQQAFISAISINYPKNAQGMAFINSRINEDKYFTDQVNVYEIGNHTIVDKFYPLIIDETINGYIRMCYKNQDTAEKFYIKNSAKNNNVAINRIAKKFPLNLLKSEML